MILAALAFAASGLDLTAFFTGKSHAENVISMALHSRHKLVVDSVGGRNKEGDFVLIDTVREEGKPERTRSWVMHQVGPNHYTGVLSDAIGPVDITVERDSAVISYLMKEGRVKIVQTLKMQADGKSLSNHVVAKKFGMTVAHVEGTIRKLD